MIVNVHLHVRDALVVPYPRDLTLDRQTLFEVVGLSFLYMPGYLAFFYFHFYLFYYKKEREGESLDS